MKRCAEAGAARWLGSWSDLWHLAAIPYTYTIK